MHPGCCNRENVSAAPQPPFLYPFWKEQQARWGSVEHPHLLPGQRKSKDHQLFLHSQWWQIPKQRKGDVPGLARMRVNQTLRNEGIWTQGQQDLIPSPHLLPGLRHFLFFLEHLGWRDIGYKTAWLWGITINPCFQWVFSKLRRNFWAPSHVRIPHFSRFNNWWILAAWVFFPFNYYVIFTITKGICKTFVLVFFPR